MAMNGNDLGDKIAAILTDSKADAKSKAKIKEIWRKIGNEIVTHIQTNAQVTVNPGQPVGTVTPPTTIGTTLTPGQGTIL